MDNKYIRLNIFPIIIEGLFVLACLLFREHYLYINFLFYTVLAIYFWSRKAFFIREWLDSLKVKKISSERYNVYIFDFFFNRYDSVQLKVAKKKDKYIIDDIIF